MLWYLRWPPCFSNMPLIIQIKSFCTGCSLSLNISEMHFAQILIRLISSPLISLCLNVIFSMRATLTTLVLFLSLSVSFLKQLYWCMIIIQKGVHIQCIQFDEIGDKYISMKPWAKTMTLTYPSLTKLSPYPLYHSYSFYLLLLSLVLLKILKIYLLGKFLSIWHRVVNYGWYVLCSKSLGLTQFVQLRFCTISLSQQPPSNHNSILCFYEFDYFRIFI